MRSFGTVAKALVAGYIAMVLHSFNTIASMVANVRISSLSLFDGADAVGTCTMNTRPTDRTVAKPSLSRGVLQKQEGGSVRFFGMTGIVGRPKFTSATIDASHWTSRSCSRSGILGLDTTEKCC